MTALRAGRQLDLDRPLDPGTKIELHLPVLVAEDYLPDVHARFASAPDDASLTLLEEEMVCCFGLLPPPAKDLFRVPRIKLRATRGRVWTSV